MQTAKFGSRVSRAPRHTNCSGIGTGSPSTVGWMPPKSRSRRPVAVTTTSASSTLPELSRIPSGTKVSIVSVTTCARPRRTALKKSASGTKQSRWSHGSYVGVKCSRTASSSPPSIFTAWPLSRPRALPGSRRQNS